MTPLTNTDPSAVANAAVCFNRCVPGGDQLGLRSYLLDQLAQISGGGGSCVTPSAPSPFSFVSATNTSITLGWKIFHNTGSFITGFQIFYGTTNGGPYPSSTPVIPLSSRTYTVTGLTSGTTYYFVIQSIAGVGCTSANSVQASGTTTGAPPHNANTIAWVNRIIANGGVSPGATTLNAADAFDTCMANNGLDVLQIALNFFAPDSQIAMLTPYYVTSGNNLWVLNGAHFAVGTGGGQFTHAGASGDTWLDTGVNPTNVFSSTNAGLSIYGAENAASQIYSLGDDTTHVCILWDNHGNMNGGMDVQWNVSHATGVAQGNYTFESFSRSSATVIAGYYANGSIGFNNATLNNGGMFSTTMDNGTILVNKTATAGNGQDNTVSFAAIHQKLTSAQTQNLFNCVQTLRQSLGGGYT